jgi:hypothetical protein
MWTTYHKTVHQTVRADDELALIRGLSMGHEKENAPQPRTTRAHHTETVTFIHQPPHDDPSEPPPHTHTTPAPVHVRHNRKTGTTDPQGEDMSGLIARIKEFSRSPQGRKAIDTARQAASDPKKQEQARKLLSKLRKRH